MGETNAGVWERGGEIPEDIGVSASRDEPEELFCHSTPEDTLGGEERKRMAQVEAHVRAELADGAGACPVALVNASLKDVADQIEILVLFVLARSRTLSRTAATPRGALVDEHLELVLDGVLFLNTVHRLATCSQPQHHIVTPSARLPIS